MDCGAAAGELPLTMFHQLVTPVGGNLVWSCLVASIPIVAVLVLLGVFRRPAWQASSAGLATALVLAIYVWRLPAGNALSSVCAGATFALIPVMWIVFNALVLYNVTVVSGRFQNFRDWMLDHLPNDRRVVLVVIGFCFGCLLEGIAGFGTPVAITSALLIALGFPALDAVVFTLIFNTAPVAFGALGAPVTTLGAVTQLSDTTLGAMIGRQLPFFALLLPFYAVGLYGGARAIRGVWPVLLIAGASFASGQFIASNYLGFALTDVISSAFSLIVTIAFLKLWRCEPDPQFSLAATALPRASHSVAPAAGWIPWIILAATVVVWIHLEVNLVGQVIVHWPRLHEAVFITIYDKPYAANWTFQPLGTGTAILVATVLTAFVVGLEARQISVVLLMSLAQIRLPALTTTLIIGLAYLMNYSGMTYTLGVGAASAGMLFPLLSAFLGWLAVSLSGSDTSGNALFGNLQVVAARQLDLHPVLMAATNSSGGVFGKMISPQNISTGTSTTELKGREGDVFARTFKHSLILTFLLGLLVLLQQYVFPWMIPS
jgi:lactate permease